MIRNETWFKELFPWVHPFLRRIGQGSMPILNGETLYITSDYSGSDKKSSHDIYSFLLTCPSYLDRWQALRVDARGRYIGDGRRLAFKNLNDRHRLRALPHFLDAARMLPGICVTLVISKSVRNLSHGATLMHQSSPLELHHRWSTAGFEKVARMTHFVALLIARFSQPRQNVYWVSDEDELFGGEARSADLAKVLGFWSGLHVQHPLGELGVGTTVIDSGDRFEEDLASIPDLVAGATREYVRALTDLTGGRLPDGLALELQKRLSFKTEAILDWMCSQSAISHVTLLIQRGARGGYSISNLDIG
jgi:hypothetical protein